MQRDWRGPGVSGLLWYVRGSWIDVESHTRQAMCCFSGLWFIVSISQLLKSLEVIKDPTPPPIQQG